jgi:trk system potassium uptake protein TrkH
MILTILMLIGGGSNSTAGGMKQYRVYFLYKAIIQQFKEMTSSHLRIVRMTYEWGDGTWVFSSRIIESLLLFIALYFGIFALGVGLMTAAGYSYLNSSFEFASALSNSGLSVGVTSPTMPGWILWLLSIGMYLGRLEIIIVFVAIGQLIRDFKRAL